MSTRRGHILVTAALISATGIGAAFVATASFSHNSVSTDDAATDGQRTVMAAAFIEPDSLAAAGVSSGAAGTVASNALSHLVNTDTTLAADYGSLVSLRGQVIAAERSVRSGKGTAQELTTLRSQLASSETDVATRLGSLRTAAFAELSTDQKDRIGVLRTQDPLGLGYPYRAMDGQTESERVGLRGALANVRTCEFADVEADGTCQSAVSSADADSDVTTASTGMQNLTVIRNSFAAALAG